MSENIDVKMITNFLTDAFECPVIYYWAETSDPKYLREDIISFVVADGAPLMGDKITNRTAIVNEESILEAVSSILSGKVKIRRDIAQQFIGLPRDWEYDQEGIDAIVQIILFNDIVYG